MSGSKCVRYGVTHDGSGMAFEVAYERNEVLRQKILLQQAMIRGVTASRPGLLVGYMPVAVGVVAAQSDARALVGALNDNQEVYRRGAAELARLQKAAERYDAQVSLEAADARAATVAVQAEAHLRLYPNDPVGAPLRPTRLPDEVPVGTLMEASRKQDEAVAQVLAALEAAQHARRAGAAELAQIRQARQASDAAAKAERVRDAERLAAQLHPEASAAARARIEALAKALTAADMLQAQQQAEAALRDALRRENDAATRQVTAREEAELLLDRLACFKVSEDIRAALAEISAGASGAETAQVLEIARHELQEAERATVAARLTEAFRELGYHVDGSFETLCARGGRVFAQGRTGWEAEYALSVKAEGERISFEVVRADAAEAGADAAPGERDIAAQQRFCDDFTRIRNMLDRGGVTTGIVTADAVGAPITLVAAHPFQAGVTRADDLIYHTVDPS